ncbi:MAG: hypothetical protein K1Y36_16400 [Blastocatellia bacterium]|nr:hypothetical protein [Blastocatellia bacterium]
MFCPKCGTSQPEGAATCILCGAVIPPPAPRTNPLDKPQRTRETQEASTKIMHPPAQPPAQGAPLPPSQIPTVMGPPPSQIPTVMGPPPSQVPTEEITRFMSGAAGNSPGGPVEATRLSGSQPIQPEGENRPYKFPANPYEAGGQPPRPQPPQPQSPFGTPYNTQFPSPLTPPPPASPYAAPGFPPQPNPMLPPTPNPANLPGPYSGGGYPGMRPPGGPQYGYGQPARTGVSGRALSGLILGIASFVACFGPLCSIPGLILCRTEITAARRGESNSSSETCANVGFWINVLNLGLAALWILAVIFAGIFG